MVLFGIRKQEMSSLSVSSLICCVKPVEESDKTFLPKLAILLLWAKLLWTDLQHNQLGLQSSSTILLISINL